MEKQQKSIRSCNTATTDDRCLHSDGKMVEKDPFPSSKIKMNTFKKKLLPAKYSCIKCRLIKNLTVGVSIVYSAMDSAKLSYGEYLVAQDLWACDVQFCLPQGCCDHYVVIQKLYFLLIRLIIVLGTYWFVRLSWERKIRIKFRYCVPRPRSLWSFRQRPAWAILCIFDL